MAQTAYEINGSSNEVTVASAKVVAKLTQVQSTMLNACKVCQKRVYDMEKIAIEQQVVFHKNCFRCTTCNGILTVRNYTIVDDKLFCKQHYMRQFKEVGGKYNFTAIQAGTPSQTPDKASLGVRTQPSYTGLGSDDHYSTRSDKDFEPRRNDHDRVTSPTKTQFDTPNGGLASPNRVVTGAVAVSSIRSMFETSRGDKDPEPAAKPTFQRSNSGKAYVESEAAVISLMKTSSTVKSRMAQFSGGSVSIDNTEEASSPKPAVRVTQDHDHKAHVRFSDEATIHQAHFEEEQGVEEAHQEEEQTNDQYETEEHYEQDGDVEYQEETNCGYSLQDGEYEENGATHEEIDDHNAENGYGHEYHNDNDEEGNYED